jgi:hypothetical protein
MRFLNAIEAEVPAGKMVHVILDNYAAHKHPRSAPGSTGTGASSSTSREPHAPGSMRSMASSPGCRLKRGLFRSVVDPQVAINRFLRRNKRRTEALHMDRRRQNHRRRQTRAPSVTGYRPATRQILQPRCGVCYAGSRRSATRAPRHLAQFHNLTVN